MKRKTGKVGLVSKIRRTLWEEGGEKTTTLEEGAQGPIATAPEDPNAPPPPLGQHVNPIDNHSLSAPLCLID